jgi:hypothetical protein
MHIYRAAARQEPEAHSQAARGRGVSRKCLILLGLVFCFFSGQFKKAVDLQGLRTPKQPLSTKLSTELGDSLGSFVKSMTYVTNAQLA